MTENKQLMEVKNSNEMLTRFFSGKMEWSYLLMVDYMLAWRRLLCQSIPCISSSKNQEILYVTLQTFAWEYVCWDNDELMMASQHGAQKLQCMCMSMCIHRSCFGHYQAPRIIFIFNKVTSKTVFKKRKKIIEQVMDSNVI